MKSTSFLRSLIVLLIVFFLPAVCAFAGQIDSLTPSPNTNSLLKLQISGTTPGTPAYVENVSYSITHPHEMASNIGMIIVRAKIFPGMFSVCGTYAHTIYLGDLLAGTYSIEYYEDEVLVDTTQVTIAQGFDIPIDISQSYIDIDNPNQITFHNVIVPGIDGHYSGTFLWNSKTLGWDIINATQEETRGSGLDIGQE